MNNQHRQVEKAILQPVTPENIGQKSYQIDDSMQVPIEEIQKFIAHQQAKSRIKGHKDNPLNYQQSGDHYKNMKIQPIVFINQNQLGFIEGCIIKRICRYKNKNGKDDLLKARHEIDVLISLEYGENNV